MRLGDLDALKEHAKNILVGESINTVLGINLYKIFEEIIDNAPTVDLTKNQAYDKGFITAMKLYSRPQGEWIPVSERLPNWWEAVLVTDECGKVFEYERRPVDDDGNLCREWRFLGRNIIAWQPLPEPYKKGGAE